MPRVLRLLVRFLVLALVPVLVLATNSAGHAATTAYGDWVTFTGMVVNDESVPGATGDRVVCSGGARWHSTIQAGPGDPGISAVIDWKVSCSTGFNVASAVLSISFDDTGCTLSSLVGEVDGAATVSGTTGAVMSPTAESCSPSQVCLNGEIEWHTNPFYSEAVAACLPLELGLPPDVEPTSSQSCPLASSVKILTTDGPTLVTDGSYHRFRGYAQFQVTTTSQLGPHTGGTWYAYAVVQDADESVGKWSEATQVYEVDSPYSLILPTQTTLDTLGVLPVNTTSEPSFVFAMSKRNPLGSGIPTSQGIIVGIGLVGVRDTSGVLGTPQQYPSAASYLTPFTALGSGDTKGYVGATRPDVCQFYWGQKIADVATSTDDEPIPFDFDNPVPDDDPEDPCVVDPESCLPGDPEPTPTGSCDFSFTNPATWATAGICQLVKLMTTLISAVKGIAGAILDGLAALFIPSESTFTDAYGDFTDDAESTDAWGWVDAASIGEDGATAGSSSVLSYSASGASMTSGSGCGGPQVTWSGFTKVGMASTWAPLQACTGITAAIAPKFKLLLTAMLVLGTLFKVVSLIGASLGIEKRGIGGGLAS